MLAKALGGGMPLGAFVASGQIMSSLTHDPSLGHITTFGGHPVCCAAGLASLEVVMKEELAQQARENLPVREIRGEGLLLALVPEKGLPIPSLVSMAPEHGLLLDYFLFCDEAFRIAPPLTISHDEIITACQRLESLMSAVSSEH